MTIKRQYQVQAWNGRRRDWVPISATMDDKERALDVFEYDRKTIAGTLRLAVREVTEWDSVAMRREDVEDATNHNGTPGSPCGRAGCVSGK